jgi:hypothetical protein
LNLFYFLSFKLLTSPVYIFISKFFYESRENYFINHHISYFIFIQACQKETRKTETINEEIATAPNIGAAVGTTVTPIQIYGAWHAGSEAVPGQL